MRRVFLMFVAALAAALACGSVAEAITNGQPDGNRHPNVGGLVNGTQYSDGTWLYCSGALISPTVFLTAAHCADDGSNVRVTFDPAYKDGDKTYAGTFQADPAYPGPSSDSHDIAVVVFDEPVTGIEPAELPTANRFNRLPKDQRFTSAGYGAYEVTNGPGGHQYLYDDVRQYATGTLNAINKTWLRISMNASTGNGGTCYGDSGGPNFLGDTSTIAAITITGDAVCRSTNVTYRLDTASARDFLDDYVALP
ncbi:MAG: S1 family peptidase [Actinomycetota bacterium]|nr:S1 family peptidase [Actinomycetota bacterium]MDQ3429662.1 S1 family peptidase [Actinomycetota bacterium]